MRWGPSWVTADKENSRCAVLTGTWEKRKCWRHHKIIGDGSLNLNYLYLCPIVEDRTEEGKEGGGSRGLDIVNIKRRSVE